VIDSEGATVPPHRISLRLVRIDSSIARNRFLTIPASILIDTAYLESLPSLNKEGERAESRPNAIEPYLGTS